MAHSASATPAAAPPVEARSLIKTRSDARSYCKPRPSSYSNSISGPEPCWVGPVANLVSPIVGQHYPRIIHTLSTHYPHKVIKKVLPLDDRFLATARHGDTKTHAQAPGGRGVRWCRRLRASCAQSAAALCAPAACTPPPAVALGCDAARPWTACWWSPRRASRAETVLS